MHLALLLVVAYGMTVITLELSTKRIVVVMMGKFLCHSIIRAITTCLFLHLIATRRPLVMSGAGSEGEGKHILLLIDEKRITRGRSLGSKA